MLSAHVSFAPDPATPACSSLVVYLPHGEAQDVAGLTERLGLPPGQQRTVRAAVPTEAGMHVLPCPGVAVPLADALQPLLAGIRTTPSWQRTVDTGAVWSAAARLALRLVAAEQVAPSLVQGPEGTVHAAWRALPDAHAESRAALERLAFALPPAGHALEVGGGRVWHAETLLRAMLDAVADVCGRLDVAPAEADRPSRPRARLLPWTARWAEALVDPVDPSVPLREDAADVIAGIDAWFGTDRGSDAGFTELRLVAPSGQDDPWVLDLGVRTPSGTLVDAAAVWAGESDADDTDGALLAEALLRGLGRAARVFDPIDRALRAAAPERILLDLDQAWDFIREVTPLLEGSDVIVVLPDDLVESPPRIRLRVGEDEPDDEADEHGPLLAGEQDDGAVPFRWEVALGDEVLSPEELDDLISRDLPLVRWQDRWVRVAPEVRERLAALSDGTMPLVEAMLLGLAGSAPVGAVPGAPPERDDAVEVVAGGKIAALVERLRSAGDALVSTEPPPGFVGELRPYQHRGVAWLGGMADLGLGAILADSMGLGKTIQLIAHLLRQGAEGPHLVVCPTSVVGNWEREVARFAPDLEVTRFHGTERATDLTGVRGVVITSYGVVRRDVDVLADVQWDVVTLDEAQHVKNPTTAGAKAVRRLPARQVCVLTGTPLENRLAELWSLLDVTNRGLLGTRGRFGRRYVAPIERRRDPAAATRLRRVVAPFILRREKDDPAVVSDLPPKIERTVVCGLTPEQAELYQAAVERTLGTGQEGSLSAASSMERRGRILALLTELKQICNHPAQYLRDRDPARANRGELLGRSGKLAVAREIVREAVTAGDRVLLFTQYVGMGELLVEQLSTDLGMAVPFLHGGVTATKRDLMVAGFQRESGEEGPPLLIVSLRAGGTGLNLTAATHVVHYDRWWNPAVEDQATDRAHRIGQHRTVEVHKLVTTGTVEERVADLLERKRALADTIVGAGEQWITELGESELRELVALSASGEELDDDPFEDDEGWDAPDEPTLRGQDPVGAGSAGGGMRS